MRVRIITTALLVLLAGCSAPAPKPAPSPTGEVMEVPVTLRDGRVVTCLVYDRDRGGALDCDWRSAR